MGLEKYCMAGSGKVNDFVLDKTALTTTAFTDQGMVATFPSYDITIIHDLKPTDVVVWEIPVDTYPAYTLNAIESAHEYLKSIFPDNEVVSIYGKLSIKENQE